MTSADTASQTRNLTMIQTFASVCSYVEPGGVSRYSSSGEPCP